MVTARTLCASAALLCGTAYAAQEGFEYPDFCSFPYLQLVNNKEAQEGGTLRREQSEGRALILASALAEQESSAMWFDPSEHPEAKETEKGQVYVAEGFETTFTFSSKNHRRGGGDGFAFVIQSESADEQGGAAGELGYGREPRSAIAGFSSVAIEFDMYENEPYHDPDGNHISIHTNGHEPNHADESERNDPNAFLQSCNGNQKNRGMPWLASLDSFNINMEDGHLHEVTIALESRLVISVDEREVLVCDLGEDIVTSAKNLDDGYAWVGFTSSTGGASSDIQLRSWKFSRHVQEGEPPRACSVGFSQLLGGSNCYVDESQATCAADGKTMEPSFANAECEDCLGLGAGGQSNTRWCCGLCDDKCYVNKFDASSGDRPGQCQNGDTIPTGCPGGESFFITLLIVLAVGLAVGGVYYAWRSRGSGYEGLGTGGGSGSSSTSFGSAKPVGRAASANNFAPYSEL